MAPYPPTREPVKPHPTSAEGTQVMSVKRPQIRALNVYQASVDEKFDIDLCNNSSNRGPKPIEELIKLQLEPKPGQCTQLSRDVTSHERRCIADVLHRNTYMFT